MRYGAISIATLLILLTLVSAPLEAAMVRQTLNQLVGGSALIVAGTVTGIEYDYADGHAKTLVSLKTEKHDELGKVPEGVKFIVAGGQVGNLTEYVSTAPRFAVGERVLVMLQRNKAGVLEVAGGYQGKFGVTGDNRISHSSKSLPTFLSEIAAIKSGVVTSTVQAPEPQADPPMGAEDIGCCGYPTADDGLPILWEDPCPNISYGVYENCANVTDELAAIQLATGSWNAVPTAATGLDYSFSASTCPTGGAPENTLCWNYLGDGGTIATTYVWFSSTPPHYVTGFDMFFNNYYTWSTSCAPGTMDVQTIALHEFGHVLLMVDQYSPECANHAMYGYGSYGTCKRSTSPDEACLTARYPLDLTPPTATINQASGQQDPAYNAPVNFTAVFSEPVTDFTGSDVIVTGTAEGTKTVNVTPNSGATFNVAVTGMTSSGTVCVAVPACVAYDRCGNCNTAPTSTDSCVTYVYPTPSDCGTFTVGTGTETWYQPLRCKNTARTQVIYLASEIGRIGYITQLSLDVSTIPGQTLENWTIRMRDTNLSTYPMGYWEAGWTTVYQSNESIATTGWHTFDLSTPFYHDGQSNLMIDFSLYGSPSSSDGFCRSSLPGGSRTVWTAISAGPGGILNPLDLDGTSNLLFVAAYVPNIRLVMSASPDPPGSFSASRPIIWPGASSTLSATPGIGGDEVWLYQGSCGGTLLGMPPQTVSPTSTTAYYAKTKNSATGCFNPDCASVTVTVKPLTDAAPIGDAKEPENGAPVFAIGVVTYVLNSSGFYVEAEDRSSATMIFKTGHGQTVGNRVAVAGTTSTSVALEKYIIADYLIPNGTGSIEPFILPTRSVGGQDWLYAESTGAGQKGVVGGSGPNNIGMLINVIGDVTYKGSNFFYVDDGSAAQDNSAYLGVKVLGTVPPPQPTPPGWTPVGKHVTVTGISSCFKAASPSTDIYRQIRAKQVILMN